MWISVLRVAVQFQRDVKGAIAIIFTAALFSIVTLVGVSVDYAQWHHGRKTTQAAMDASVLAAGRTMQLPGTTEEDIIETAESFYKENRGDTLAGHEKVKFYADKSAGKVWATSEGLSLVPSFLSLIGIKDLPITLTSAARLDDTDIEVSLMLDITASMDMQGAELSENEALSDDSKLADLKDAAKMLINRVVSDEQTPFKSRVALVPFSTFVNVGTKYFDEVTGFVKINGYASGYDEKLTCVAERIGVERYTDAPPDSYDGYFTYLTGVFPEFTEECPIKSTITPLTDKKVELIKKIEGLRPKGATAGHLGIAWTWYALSSNWKSVWSDAFDNLGGNYYDVNVNPAPVRRFAVLMTDGDFNIQTTGEPSRYQARDLCENMKKDDIIVFAVGFDIPKNSSGDYTMYHCASTPAHYYNAANGEALRAAYIDIATKIVKLRIAE